MTIDDTDIYSLDIYLLNLTQCNEFHYLKNKYSNYINLDIKQYQNLFIKKIIILLLMLIILIILWFLVRIQP